MSKTEDLLRAREDSPGRDHGKGRDYGCAPRGGLGGTYGNVMQVLMPLVITDSQLDKGLSILEESLGEIR
jgi:hypothetical protein